MYGNEINSGADVFSAVFWKKEVQLVFSMGQWKFHGLIAAPVKDCFSAMEYLNLVLPAVDYLYSLGLIFF